MFLTYFAEMSESITERERRSFQKLEPTANYFREENQKLEYLDLPDDILKKERARLKHLERVTSEVVRLQASISLETSANTKKGLERQVSDEEWAKLGQIYQINVVKEYVF